MLSRLGLFGLLLVVAVVGVQACAPRRPAPAIATPTPDLPPLQAEEVVARMLAALDKTSSLRLVGKSTGTGMDYDVEIVSTRGERSIKRTGPDVQEEEVHAGADVWVRRANGEWARQPATAGSLFTTYVGDEWKVALTKGRVELRGVEPLLNRRIYVVSATTESQLWTEVLTWWVEDDQFQPTRLRQVHTITASGRENRVEAQVDFRKRQVKVPR